MAKRKIDHEPTDYHTAVNLIYNGVKGEYLITIPARDLSAFEVCEQAARLDMSVGGFVEMVTVEATNNRGEALYIIPVEKKPKRTKSRDDETKSGIED